MMAFLRSARQPSYISRASASCLKRRIWRSRAASTTTCSVRFPSDTLYSWRAESLSICFSRAMRPSFGLLSACKYSRAAPEATRTVWRMAFSWLRSCISCAHIHLISFFTSSPSTLLASRSEGGSVAPLSGGGGVWGRPDVFWIVSFILRSNSLSSLVTCSYLPPSPQSGFSQAGFCPSALPTISATSPSRVKAMMCENLVVDSMMTGVR
mmetsp:Transcript_9660/g.19351  ORF Transcript_9660/g.19351 Transcript_9660/m.19351 type:complete len:210 (-) Transcript_9660:524-1153(-)